MFGNMNMNMNDNSFFPGMPGGMPRGRPGTRSDSFSRASPSPKAEKPAEITRPLKVSLEDLYNGTVKHLKVGRKRMDGSTEDRVLDIQIHPGWKSGTKIRFPKAGNELPPMGDAQDLVFVVEEKPHEVFKRDDNNLIANIKIPLVDALTGSPSGTKEKVLELLDGRKLRIPFPFGVVKPGQQTTINGEGMPIRKDGAMRTKGDLIVTWEVVFPDSLTHSQKEGVRKVLG
jgi:DnaJ family protein B protein 4